MESPDGEDSYQPAGEELGDVNGLGSQHGNSRDPGQDGRVGGLDHRRRRVGPRRTRRRSAPLRSPTWQASAAVEVTRPQALDRMNPDHGHASHAVWQSIMWLIDDAGVVDSAMVSILSAALRPLLLVLVRGPRRRLGSS